SLYYLSFFFSSRRRHTRSKRDWSSDVCSSDLILPLLQIHAVGTQMDTCKHHFLTSGFRKTPYLLQHILRPAAPHPSAGIGNDARSEERRVGKERRTESGARE